MIYLLVILFLVPTNLVAADYYVDYESGDNTNAGTSSGVPWQHLPWDSRASDNAVTSLSAGDSIYLNRGTVYEAGTGQSGNFIVIDDSGTNANHITIGAYGSGDKPIIAAGQQLDESQFALYSGTPGSNAVYRATNTSLGLTGINISTVFESANFNTFDPLSDSYAEESGVSLGINDFYQEGTASGDYLYIRGSDSDSPTDKALYADWMAKTIYSTGEYYTLENLTVYGGSTFTIEVTGSTGSNRVLTLDTVDLGWGDTGVVTTSAVHITNSRIHYYYRNESDGSSVAIGSTGIGSLIEDSSFIRARNILRFGGTGGAANEHTVRRCFFMDMPTNAYYGGLHVLQHCQRLSATSDTYLKSYRNLFFNSGNDILFDNGANTWGRLQFWNNTVYEARAGFDFKSVIDPYYNDEYLMDYRNNVSVNRRTHLNADGVYGVYTNADYDNLLQDYNYYAHNGSEDYLFYGFPSGSETTYTSYTVAQMQTFLTDTASANINGRETNSIFGDTDSIDLLDVFESITYGDANFLKPKVGGVLVDAGTTISTGENNIDYGGSAITGTYDIGAYEYVSGAQTIGAVLGIRISPLWHIIP